MYSVPLLSAAQEKELALQIALGGESGKQARERFIAANQRLVWNIARNYQGNGVELMDLVQEGNIGLIRAVEKFDPGRGNKFSTLATWWIKQSVMRAIEDTGRTIRLPTHIHVETAKVRREETRLTAELDRPPTEKELADAVGISVAHVEGLRSLPWTFSLSTPVGDDDDLNLADVLADPTEQLEEHAVEAIASQEMRDLLEEILTPRELLVVCKRFGIGITDQRKLAELGRELGRSRERIRQIERKALEKLRRAPQIAVLIAQ
jgi:RNA polymerase primary sigma factor